jgi:GGDEF domain-containing protein
MPSGSLERHELQTILLACLAIIMLAVTVAVFVYPVVFSPTASAIVRIMTVAAFGFCVLSILQAIYLVDRQVTIKHLRQQIREERKTSSKVLKQASVDLFETLAHFSSFQDQLLAECERAATYKQNLTVLIIATQVHEAFSEPSLSRPILGDVAKAISRKLREQDSIYILTYGSFGVILPGVDALAAQRVSDRVVEGLTDATGASKRFSFNVDAISYPDQTPSAHDLELAITELLSDQSLDRNHEKFSHPDERAPHNIGA